MQRIEALRRGVHQRLVEQELSREASLAFRA